MTTDPQGYSREIIRAVCCLAGSTGFLDDVGNTQEKGGRGRIIERHDTPKLFEWLLHAFNFQGIADQIASGYIDQHGLPGWNDIYKSARRLQPVPSSFFAWRSG